jgi:hypothetical protein
VVEFAIALVGIREVTLTIPAENSWIHYSPSWYKGSDSNNTSRKQHSSNKMNIFFFCHLKQPLETLSPETWTLHRKWAWSEDGTTTSLALSYLVILFLQSLLRSLWPRPDGLGVILNKRTRGIHVESKWKTM